MNDKPFAWLVVAGAAAPFCAVCILGPAALGSFFGGAFGWLAGFDPVVGTGLAITGGILVLAFLYWRRQRMPLRDDAAAPGGPTGVGTFRRGIAPDGGAPLEAPRADTSEPTAGSRR